jgi:hypothetical protein
VSGWWNTSPTRYSLLPTHFLHLFLPPPGKAFGKINVSMDINMITLIVAFVAMLVSFYTIYVVNDRRKRSVQEPDGFNTRPLQLQAYERLVMLTERIALPSLVSRANQPGMNSRDMQTLLIDSIKQEYEYNATQQIYVSPVAWEAVKSLKDQNIYIINQISATLPSEAMGLDLNKRLMEFSMTQKKGALHEIVLEALNYEAKKIMK